MPEPRYYKYMITNLDELEFDDDVIQYLSDLVDQLKERQAHG